ncbi:hypothetical protein, partial [Klebsiella oxytoca]|uniref:hypothetical protein n=1 Tax=Klebsiella oxytoca TaxID=571 RepID=UPI003AAFBC70
PGCGWRLTRATRPADGGEPWGDRPADGGEPVARARRVKRRPREQRAGWHNSRRRCCASVRATDPQKAVNHGATGPQTAVNL